MRGESVDAKDEQQLDVGSFAQPVEMPMAHRGPRRPPVEHKKGGWLYGCIAIAVFGWVLFSILVPSRIGGAEDTKITKARVLIDNLGTALQEYYAVHGCYPPDEGAEPWGTEALTRELRAQGIYEFSDDELIEMPQGSGRYQIVDVWRTPLRYRNWQALPNAERSGAFNEGGFDLWSAGENMTFADPQDNGDNVTNWAEIEDPYVPRD